MPFFLIFFIIPLMEVFAFIQVGDEIGVLRTLLLCVLTAGIGGALVRHQGLEILMRGRETLQQGQMPVEALYDGFCIVAAGAMLITPGFVTDTLGFALLIPPVRKILRIYLARHMKLHTSAANQNAGFRPPPSHDTNIIEGEYERLDTDEENLKDE